MWLTGILVGCLDAVAVAVCLRHHVVVYQQRAAADTLRLGYEVVGAGLVAGAGAVVHIPAGGAMPPLTLWRTEAQALYAAALAAAACQL
jgi:hypothetical protein